MKKIFTSIFFAVLFFSGSAQSNMYQNVKRLINEFYPAISTENKLIAYNIWSAGDMGSREANKQFEKAYSVYESALLKGGRKGLVVISINTDNLSSNAVIAYTKDGITKLLSFKSSDIEGLDSNTKNAVFDSGGNEVYKNLNTQSIFNSIHKLITR